MDAIANGFDDAYAAYAARLSGPVLDTLDLQIEVPALTSQELLAASSGEASAVVRGRVIAARAIQRERGALNAHLTDATLRACCVLDPAGRRPVGDAVDRGGMSARGVRCALRVARTIADPAAEEHITALCLGLLSRVAYRTLHAYAGAALGEPDAVPGVISLAQSFGSLAHWHPHLHLVVSDGGFRRDGSFVEIPAHDAVVLAEAWRRALPAYVSRGTGHPTHAARTAAPAPGGPVAAQDGPRTHQSYVVTPGSTGVPLI